MNIDKDIVLWAFPCRIYGWNADFTNGYGVTLLIKQLTTTVLPWFLKKGIYVLLIPSLSSEKFKIAITMKSFCDWFSCIFRLFTIKYTFSSGLADITTGA